VETFNLQAKKWNSRPLVYFRENGSYTSKSWSQMQELVDSTAKYLIDSGIKKGDRVALFSFNRWEWWVADMAILSIGAVCVPVYPTNSAEESRYVIDHSGSKLCFIGNEEQLEKVLEVKKRLRSLKTIVTFYDEHGRKGISTLSSAIAAGRKSKKVKEYDKRRKAVDPESMATIVYTSGTTGDPKGVMLSHDNIQSDVRQLVDVFGAYVDETDRFLSCLPLSHALERVTGYYTPIALSCSVAFAEHFRTMQRDLQEIQPTVMISVPRLFEKIHAGVLATISGFPFYKRAVFGWALGVGRKRIPYLCANTEPKGLLAKKLSFVDNSIFSVLKKQIGFSGLRVAISGGGPLSVNDMEFFHSIGINVFEGYGLTEATPVTNVNKVGCIKPGTVGPGMSETTIRISDEGEVLVKGPQVMMGYYKNKEATKEAILKDGYLKTGDLGVLDEDGYMTITGRIKDIIVTASGKNISPQNIELSLGSSKFIEYVAIIGDRRKYLSALIIPDFAELEKWAKKKGIVYSGRKDMVSHGDVKNLFTHEIENIMKDFARVEQVRNFTLLDDAWSIDSGELTGSLKIKRRVVEAKYAAVIDAMYGEQA
jgi:long-chain acyl-CoA synthetase